MHEGILQKMSERDHEQVVFCQNDDVGLKAIIAIHNTILGPSLGGVRMWPYASEEEAIIDVLRLSRGMTYKAAVAGLPLGGGKAVIIADPKKEKSQELFEAFGRFVDSLGGRYITAEDMGISVEDVDIIRTQTKYVVGTARSGGGSGDPSPYTALGVFLGIKTCVEKLFGPESLRGKRVVVQGVGSVGVKLVERLVAEGALVTVADIDLERIKALQSQLDVEVISESQVYDQECDIFAPCAIGGVLNDDTIPRLRCKIVAGGANNQLKKLEDADLLRAQGILYAPDYVINVGGLISVFQELGEYGEEGCVERIHAVSRNLKQLIEISEKNDISTALAANHLVEHKLSEVKAKTACKEEKAVV